MFFQNIRSLQFDEKPNYEYLRNLFKNLALKTGIAYDFIFDWTNKGFTKDKLEVIKKVI